MNELPDSLWWWSLELMALLLVMVVPRMSLPMSWTALLLYDFSFNLLMEASFLTQGYKESEISIYFLCKNYCLHTPYLLKDTLRPHAIIFSYAFTRRQSCDRFHCASLFLWAQQLTPLSLASSILPKLVWLFDILPPVIQLICVILHH